VNTVLTARRETRWAGVHLKPSHMLGVVSDRLPNDYQGQADDGADDHDERKCPERHEGSRCGPRSVPWDPQVRDAAKLSTCRLPKHHVGGISPNHTGQQQGADESTSSNRREQECEAGERDERERF
jgi:hypothetical protein